MRPSRRIPAMSVLTKGWLYLCILLAAGLRAPGLFDNRFHPDEALFATWARLIATWRDPLLASASVDKPPLLFYLQALFYPLFGPLEAAARWPNWIASLLLVVLVARLSWGLFGDELATATAATFTAISPLAVQFSGTAFTDPLLVAWLMLSLLFALESAELPGGKLPGGLRREMRHTFLTGFFFGLAVATKHQAWIFLPLIVGLAWQRRWQWRHLLPALMGLSIVLILLSGWELSRGADLVLWQTQIANYGGVRLARSWELWPRLQGWLVLWRYMFGSLALVGCFLLVAPILPVSGKTKPRDADAYEAGPIIMLFLWGYFILHWYLAVPIWDRYLLPAVPLVALILGRGLSRYWSRLVATKGTDRVAFRQLRLIVLLAVGGLALLQLPWAWQARQRLLPVGGSPWADDGASLVAEVLAEEPYGTVLYDHWYSWQWRYHLLDKRVFVNWFPHADALIADLRVFGETGGRLLALPHTPAAEPVHRWLKEAGFSLEPIPVGSAENEIRLYRITRE